MARGWPLAKSPGLPLAGALLPIGPLARVAVVEALVVLAGATTSVAVLGSCLLTKQTLVFPIGEVRPEAQDLRVHHLRLVSRAVEWMGSGDPRTCPMATIGLPKRTAVMSSRMQFLE